MNNTTTKTKGKYAELKERHQQMWNELPIKYAFGNLQFSKMVDSFGLSMDENAENYYGGKLIPIGYGGYIRKDDVDKISEYNETVKAENKAAIEAAKNNEKDGKGFLFEMFTTELFNHEYALTEDLSEALRACGVTADEINNSPYMLKALKNACDYVRKNTRM